MNKKYIEPEMEIVSIEDVDIIASSDPNGVPSYNFDNLNGAGMAGHLPTSGNGEKTPFIPSSN